MFNVQMALVRQEFQCLYSYLVLTLLISSHRYPGQTAEDPFQVMTLSLCYCLDHGYGVILRREPFLLSKHMTKVFLKPQWNLCVCMTYKGGLTFADVSAV